MNIFWFLSSLWQKIECEDKIRFIKRLYLGLCKRTHKHLFYKMSQTNVQVILLYKPTTCSFRWSWRCWFHHWLFLTHRSGSGPNTAALGSRVWCPGGGSGACCWERSGSTAIRPRRSTGPEPGNTRRRRFRTSHSDAASPAPHLPLSPHRGTAAGGRAGLSGEDGDGGSSRAGLV